MVNEGKRKKLFQRELENDFLETAFSMVYLLSYFSGAEKNAFFLRKIEKRIIYSPGCRLRVYSLPVVIPGFLRRGEDMQQKGFSGKRYRANVFYSLALIASLSFSYPGLFNRANIFFL